MATMRSSEALEGQPRKNGRSQGGPKVVHFGTLFSCVFFWAVPTWKKRGSRRHSRKQGRNRSGLSTHSDPLEEAPVCTPAQFSLFQHVSKKLPNCVRKGIVLRSKMRQKVAGGVWGDFWGARGGTFCIFSRCSCSKEASEAKMATYAKMTYSTALLLCF